MGTQLTSIKNRLCLQHSRVLLLGFLIITFSACTDSASGPDITEGFEGGWALNNWSQSGILGGTTSMSGSAEQLSMIYNVDLGNPGGGVSQRTAIFSIVVPESGIVEFDWLWTGFHAFFRANGELSVKSESETIELQNEGAASSFEFMGSTSIEVTEGETLEIEVGGSNFDSNSRLRGEVTLTNFTVTPASDS
jgi:hypothetical protein